MEDASEIDQEIITTVGKVNSALVALLEHVLATDKALIAVVGMLTDRALSEQRLDDVRPIVKALGDTKKTSHTALSSFKDAIIASENLARLGKNNEE